MQNLDVKGADNFAKLGQEVTMTIEDSPKPIIAAVNGFANAGYTPVVPYEYEWLDAMDQNEFQQLIGGLNYIAKSTCFVS